MNRISITIAAFAFLAFAACESPMTALDEVSGDAEVTLGKSDRAPVVKVTGGGSIVREDIDGSPRETYGFNAQMDAAGNVSGQAEVHFPSDEFNFHVDITCLSVDGNVAWLGGVQTWASDESILPNGTEWVWTVVDNGNGAAAEPDRTSNYVFGVPASVCNDPFFALETFEWDNGGVTIH